MQIIRALTGTREHILISSDVPTDWFVQLAQLIPTQSEAKPALEAGIDRFRDCLLERGYKISQEIKIITNTTVIDKVTTGMTMEDVICPQPGALTIVLKFEEPLEDTSDAFSDACFDILSGMQKQVAGLLQLLAILADDPADPPSTDADHPGHPVYALYRELTARQKTCPNLVVVLSDSLPRTLTVTYRDISSKGYRITPHTRTSSLVTYPCGHTDITSVTTEAELLKLFFAHIGHH
jgi:hypothetical protein